jgi:hypothetical protein
MKSSSNILAFLAIAFLYGCATSHGPNGLVLDTVGPAMPPTQMTRSVSANGTLAVYSAYRRNADFNARDPYRPEYSDYKIFFPDGRLQQSVHNNSGTILQDVVPVVLPAGKYQVKARANGYGFVIIPVVIKANQTTVLHLEGGGFWPDESGFNQTNAVRLPDGLIIGWKG